MTENKDIMFLICSNENAHTGVDAKQSVGFNILYISV